MTVRQRGYAWLLQVRRGRRDLVDDVRPLYAGAGDNTNNGLARLEVSLSMQPDKTGDSGQRGTLEEETPTCHSLNCLAQLVFR